MLRSMSLFLFNFPRCSLKENYLLAYFLIPSSFLCVILYMLPSLFSSFFLLTTYLFLALSPSPLTPNSILKIIEFGIKFK